MIERGAKEILGDCIDFIWRNMPRMCFHTNIYMYNILQNQTIYVDLNREFDLYYMKEREVIDKLAQNFVLIFFVLNIIRIVKLTLLMYTHIIKWPPVWFEKRETSCKKASCSPHTHHWPILWILHRIRIRVQVLTLRSMIHSFYTVQNAV